MPGYPARLRTRKGISPKPTVVFVLALALAASAASSPARGHGGGLDADGCHTESATGQYHCHGDGAPGDEGVGLGNGDRACARISIEDRVTHVRDGDTIEVGGLPIRLDGVAAPERDERGGRKATRTMKKLVRNETLWCDLTGEGTYDRCVAICYVDVRDVGAVMVHRGVARDCRAFSGGRYARLEQAAVERGSRIREIYRLPSYCLSD
ncbi:MAG TPA: thermonuclease family protein [Geminicoccaceae bacterium]